MKVLIVEDNEDEMFLLQKVLQVKCFLQFHLILKKQPLLNSINSKFNHLGNDLLIL